MQFPSTFGLRSACAPRVIARADIPAAPGAESAVGAIYAGFAAVLAAFAAARPRRLQAGSLAAEEGCSRTDRRCWQTSPAAGAWMQPAEARRVLALFDAMMFDEEMEDIRLYDLSETEEGIVEGSGGDSTYGEVSLDLLDWFLERLPVDEQHILCDLGSGGGRALLYLALCSGRDAIGVELSATRHRSAETLLALASPFLRPGQRIILHRGDIVDPVGPQRDATVVLITNRLFDECFTTRALATTPHARHVLALRPIPDLDGALVETADLPTSWIRDQAVWLYACHRAPGYSRR